ncbi:histidine kinase [uncultured Methylobacterium sp.]|uniref:type III secretion apparatus assembly chaperone SctY n=1 Tax=uncultured Methylobacterium sp. TaxID=157278 RepID=UPI0025984BDE|nr:histidine kinase [uncultured Methylobacterium sp.]
MVDATHDREPGHALPAPVSARPLAVPADRMPLIAREQRDLLCALAYVALGVGDGPQAVTLLDLVLREAPADAGVLRLMAYARVATGDGAGALDALDRLVDLRDDDGDGDPPAPLLLLRSQALRLAGRLDEGRATFRRFVAARRGHTPNREIAA